MTNETTPRQIWMHNVITGAGVSVEDAAPFRAKLGLWYTAGESIDMAASTLKWLVPESKRQLRLEELAKADGLASIRKGIKEGVTIRS